MKKKIEIDDTQAVAESLRDLTTYLSGMYLSPGETFMTADTEQLMTEYFRSTVLKIDTEYEKMLAAAITKSCFDDQDIPREDIARVAKRMSTEFLESLRACKRKYQYLCAEGPFKDMVPGTREAKKQLNLEQRKLRAANKALMRIRIKGTIKKLSGRLVKRTAIFQTTVAVFTNTLGKTRSVKIASITAFVTMLIDSLLPKNVRKSFKDKAEHVRDLVRDTTKRLVTQVADKMSNSPLGEKVVKVVSNVGTAVREVGQTVKGTVKSLAEKGKKSLSRMVKWVKAKLA